MFQWGHNLTVMDTGLLQRLDKRSRLQVSMGPQPHGHGYFVSRTTLMRRRIGGFNGATTSRSWILCESDDAYAEAYRWFQWGHNLTVMDTPTT